MKGLAMASASMISFLGLVADGRVHYFANNSRTSTRHATVFQSSEYAAVVEIGRHVWGLYPVIVAVEARGNISARPLTGAQPQACIRLAGSNPACRTTIV